MTDGPVFMEVKSPTGELMYVRRYSVVALSDGGRRNGKDTTILFTGPAGSFTVVGRPCELLDKVTGGRW